MYRFIQKHGKKLMAVFSAFLMIAFALPAASKYAGGGANRVVGHLPDDKIHAVEVYNASQAWETLNRMPTPGDPQGRPMSLILGSTAYQEIHEHPVMFLLLQKEARNLGISVSNDQIQTIMQNSPWASTTNPDQLQAYQNALAQLLLVRQGFARAVSAIKVTDAMVSRDLAMFMQNINLNTVEFNVAKYRDKVTAPTAEQLKQQFDTYADVVRGNVTKANPFGFGYKYPDRVKFQYISIPRADLRKGVESSKDSYAWEVEAQKYYLQHQKEFPTPPATQPAGSSAFSLESSSRATTKPFVEVRDQIKNRLIDDAVKKKLQQVQDRINSTLTGDWNAYHTAAGAATRPTTAPASSLGVAYDSFEYLQKLAKLVQEQTGVLPTVVNVADNWQSAEDLAKLPGIGQAVVSGAAQSLATPVYLTIFNARFVPEENREQTGILHELEPSRTLIDDKDTLYITRLTASDPSHKPATLAEVEKQVTDDVITKQAYELAKADAAKLLDQARQRRDLDAAVAGKGIVKVGPLRNSPGEQIIALGLSGTVADAFRDEAFALLSAAPSTQPSTQPANPPAAQTASTQSASAVASATTAPSDHPVGLIELPQTGKVLVAQVTEVQATWTDRSLPIQQAQISMMIRGELEQRFQRDWFTWNAVTKRLGYVEDASAKGETNQRGAPPPPPQAPIF